MFTIYLNQMHSGFKKKNEPLQSNPSFDEKMNMLLGLGSDKHLKGKISRQLILDCANFWNSKQRIDKIKSLILKDQQLDAFEDTEDFSVDELMEIELLSLSKNKITYLQPLKVLDTLICLNINYNKVYDLSPLSQLVKMQELYASNNQITNIDALKALQNLRILNLYENKINRLQESTKILQQLRELQELDIENNPIYGQDTRKHFLALHIMRLNGDLILEQEKGKQVMMSTSCIIMPAAKFRDTKSSFFNQTQNSQSPQVLPIEQKLNNLQTTYSELDEKFENQISKNVELKASYHKKVTDKKKKSEEKIEMKEKGEEIKELKRKVKTLKENLFTKDEKGDLLRAIFEADMMKDRRIESPKIDINPRMPVWTRKFDYDEEIVIEKGRQLDEDEEIEQLLSNNNSAIQQLKRELREFRND